MLILYNNIWWLIEQILPLKIFFLSFMAILGPLHFYINFDIVSPVLHIPPKKNQKQKQHVNINIALNLSIDEELTPLQYWIFYNIILKFIQERHQRYGSMRGALDLSPWNYNKLNNYN